MNGALPPSSSDTGMIFSAVWARISRPARVEPVTVTIAVTGCSTSAFPTVRPRPVTTFTRPAGTPASSHTRASAIGASGVTSDGLRTMALPAIRAGPTLRAKIAAGKFHGMIATTTPCGSSRTSSCSCRPAAATTSPTCRYRWANAWSKNALTPPISPRASVIVLPCSATTIRASSSACRSTSRITAPITSARSPRVSRAHSFCAAAAACEHLVDVLLARLRHRREHLAGRGVLDVARLLGRDPAVADPHRGPLAEQGAGAEDRRRGRLGARIAAGVGGGGGGVGRRAHWDLLSCACESGAP